jgi:hypothetical protein
MSTSRGIFENFPNQPPTHKDSPFTVAQEPPASPFTAVARQESPFVVVNDAPEPSNASKALERRRTDSPFQVAEPSEGFGFEASPPAAAAAPFKAAPAAPFSAPAAGSPFSGETPRAASVTTQAAIAAFRNWQETPAATAATAPTPPAQDTQMPTFTPAFTPAAAPVATTPKHPTQPIIPASTPAPVAKTEAAAALVNDGTQSDSFSIRQLELRAIFGVDREMTHDEIFQRSRALPGMRNIARVAAQDMATIESLKNLLPNLGFGTGGLKLYAGAVPLEFIREGNVLLAVQTDGGFAPGVRETLMLVARELGRPA